MASDEGREAMALAWSERLIGDVADTDMSFGEVVRPSQQEVRSSET